MKKRIFFFCIIVLFCDQAFADDPVGMINKWIELIKVPARLVLGVLFSLTGYKWFSEDKRDGRRATGYAFVGICVFFIGFELISWMMG